MIGLFLATSASALVTINVNNTTDAVDYAPGDGVCETGLHNGICTLRAAVMEANKTDDNVTINLPAGTYTLGAPAGADDDASGDLNLSAPAFGNPVVTITGSGSATTFIEGISVDRVLSVDNGRTAVIGKVTLRNGFFAGVGGGLLNHGVLTLTNVVVRDNHIGQNYCGAGIYNDNQLGIYSSTITSNVAAAGSGGGICNGGSGGLTIVNSTIDTNHALEGGGIDNNGVSVMVNSTISQNRANGNGGGIVNAGTSDIYNSTIVYNEADADADGVGIGAGIYNYINPVINIRNTIVAENYVSGVQSYDDCAGEIGMYGNNTFSPFGDCTVPASSPGTATPLDSLYELGILRNNGGPTETVALVPPSRTIDGGLGCSDQTNALLTTDQRYRPRIVGLACDIGAFEYDADYIFANGF